MIHGQGPQADEAGESLRVSRLEGRADAGQALRQVPQEQIQRHRVADGQSRRRERVGRNERQKVIEPLDLLPELLKDERSKILGHA